MVFKPFKPPLIRKPDSSTENQNEQEQPPNKKPRIQKEDQVLDSETRPAALASRKPLLQVQNPSKDSALKTSPGGVSKDDASFERFFNALWLVQPASGPFPHTFQTRNSSSHVLSPGENRAQRRTKLGMEMEYLQLARDSSTYVT